MKLRNVSNIKSPKETIRSLPLLSSQYHDFSFPSNIRDSNSFIIQLLQFFLSPNVCFIVAIEKFLLCSFITFIIQQLRDTQRSLTLSQDKVNTSLSLQQMITNSIERYSVDCIDSLHYQMTRQPYMHHRVNIISCRNNWYYSMRNATLISFRHIVRSQCFLQ